MEQNIQGVGDVRLLLFFFKPILGPITTQKAMFHIQSDMINSSQHRVPIEETDDTPPREMASCSAFSSRIIFSQRPSTLHQ